MMDDVIAMEVAALGSDAEVRTILEEVCRVTGMGFAAVARVTETRWVACQVLDKVEFGLEPGDELKIKTTICDEIRQSGVGVIIDEVRAEPRWRSHPTPILYGFQSYVSLPILLPDGSFFGTLCAIDPSPRMISGPELVAVLTGFAERVAAIVADKMLPLSS